MDPQNLNIQIATFHQCVYGGRHRLLPCLDRYIRSTPLSFPKHPLTLDVA
ncbi:hypothetical protein Hanom_Chr10g00958401 [Helianthus anomalus]